MRCMANLGKALQRCQKNGLIKFPKVPDEVRFGATILQDRALIISHTIVTANTVTFVCFRT